MSASATTDLDPRLAELIDRSRRLGADRSLVVFGGGNTSTKAMIVDHLGREQRVMWVKGSGSDLVSVQPNDFPALRLEDIDPLKQFDELDDDEMVNLVSRAIVDPASKRPSIETLLHGFLPFPHIDHVHADAICTLTNHAGGRDTVREALGDGFAYVDWIRPGFRLSKLVSGLADYEGVVLAQHGLITWADTSEACYERTTSVVDQARQFVEANKLQHAAAPVACPDLPADELHDLMLQLRGRLSKSKPTTLRVDTRLREIADRPDLDEIVEAGSASADHMLRMRLFSCALADPADDRAVDEAIDQYVSRYEQLVADHLDQMPPGGVPHDPHPAVFLAPGVGAITAGVDRAETAMISEIAWHTHSVARDTKDAFGPPTRMPDAELFGFDYWPMELYKLTLKPPPKAFAGKVIVVTGAASGIGRGIAKHLAGLGASLVLADINESGLDETAELIALAGSKDPLIHAGDQSQSAVIDDMVGRSIEHFGGFDGIVASAGIGMPGALHELTDEQWERALSINLTSGFLLTRAAMRTLRQQGSGGSLVYIASKNAFAPGASFGAYSVSKAGMIQLMRIAAMEGGEHGIRANAVNPDAVFDGSGLWAGGVREERAAAHGIAPDELEDFYAKRNLLNRRVTTVDVAATVGYLLSDQSSRTTGTVVPVDGGVVGGFPR